MTNTHRDSILQLRLAGMGYEKIAQTLAISVNTVKAFCRRNGLAGTRAVITAHNARNTESQNSGGQTGQIDLINRENRGNSNDAGSPESVDTTGLSDAQTVPLIQLGFAQQSDDKAVREVLGMLMRTVYAQKR